MSLPENEKPAVMGVDNLAASEASSGAVPDYEAMERAEIYRAAQRLNHLLDLVEPHLPAVLEQLENLGPLVEGITNSPMMKMLKFKI